MTRAELGGHHTHITTCGVNVQVWQRAGRYLARGSVSCRRFGVTLGATEAEAAPALRRLLTRIEDGAFVRPSEARRRRPMGPAVAPRLTLRQLVDEYLADRRKIRGEATADTYLSRLRPVLDFAELPANRTRWPLAAEIDREFAIALRSYLHRLTTSRNGKPGAARRPLSAKQINNVLECARGALAWAAKTEVRRLPADWSNPLTPEVIGRPPTKDPLREDRLPMTLRVRLVERMDLWRLCHLATSLVLPLRPGEAAGLLIGDIDWGKRRLEFGTRFGGADFTKGGTSFKLPFPAELEPLLRVCVGGRPEGPLLRDRRAFAGRRKVAYIASKGELEVLLGRGLSAARAGKVATAQDRKAVFRGLLRELGGVSEDQLGREFRQVAELAGVKGVAVGGLRHSVTTAMNDCGMRPLELRYLTSHATSDILNEYVRLDIDAAMTTYFEAARPLLTAIAERAESLGVRP